MTAKRITNYITQDNTAMEPDHSVHILDLTFFTHLDDAYMVHLKNVLLTFGVKEVITSDSRTKIAEVEDVGLDSEVGLAALSADEEKVVLLWDSAFQTYLSELEKTLEDWVIKRKQDLFQTVKNEGNRQHLTKILDQIVPKMVAIVELKIHLRYNALPAVQSAPPFFTRLWYGDLAKSIADCNDGIKIVCFFLFEIYILMTFVNLIS